VRDLSTRGIYFVGDTAVRIGSLLELHLTLPDAGPAGPLHCRISARVLRVDHVGDRHGVAAEIHAWRTTDLDDVE
jgi:hypothetical protein